MLIMEYKVCMNQPKDLHYKKISLVQEYQQSGISLMFPC